MNLNCIIFAMNNSLLESSINRTISKLKKFNYRVSHLEYHPNSETTTDKITCAISFYCATTETNLSNEDDLLYANLYKILESEGVITFGIVVRSNKRTLWDVGNAKWKNNVL